MAWIAVDKSINLNFDNNGKIEGNILYLSKGIGIDGAFSVDVGQDMSYIASISFVHQLQHLFFGLGLNSEMEV